MQTAAKRLLKPLTIATLNNSMVTYVLSLMNDRTQEQALISVLFVPFLLQTIHVAIVCAGYNASRDVVTLVKSVLFHR